MKLTNLLLLITVLNVFGSKTYSQNAKLNLDMKDVPILTVLNAIEDQSEFFFLYSSKMIDITQKVNIYADNENVNKVLDNVLMNTGIIYTVKDRQILLMNKNLKTGSNSEQQRTITGKITDAGTKEPMIGVNIQVKGTTTGAITDVNGQFSLAIPSQNDILVVSFIGYTTQEIPVSNRSIIDVELAPELTGLDEVVVIGYGTQKKKLVTGSTVEVQSDDITKRVDISPLSALQGQTPGLSITSTTGQPGSDFVISIRGAGTVSSTTPLFIVDGVQTSDIRFLNNNDIASIDILKDAASAAIYGARAANGVILITTKKGTSGSSRFSFDAYYGIQSPSKVIKVLDARNYIDMMNEMATNSGLTLPYPNETKNQDLINSVNGGTDYVGLMLEKNVPTQNYNLSVQGGSNTSVYAMSLSYSQQAGIIGGKSIENYDRYTFRINTENKLYKDILKVGENFNFSSTLNTGGNNNTRMGSAIRMPPVIPNMNPSNPSEFYYNNSPAAGGDNDHGLWSTEITNPYATMLYENERLANANKIVGDFYVNLKINKSLNFKTSISVDYSAQKSRNYDPLYPDISIGTNSTSRVTAVQQSFSDRLTLTFDNILNYSKTINTVHQVDGMVGMSAYKNNSEYVSAGNKNLLYTGLEYAWIDNATGNASGGTMTMSGYPSDEALLSYFSRVSYAYKETYLITAILRSDGSSRFDKDYRRGYFPSISVGWNMTNESFMKNNAPWLNSFKLRASWGQNGNMNIPPYYYMPLISSAYEYSFGGDGRMETGSVIYRAGNPTLSWEKAQSSNIGFDSRILGGKLGFVFDLYSRETKDWLIRANTPTIIGVDPPYINGGSVVNRGAEFSVDYSDMIGTEFSFSVRANIAFNQNKVGKIPTKDGILHGGTGTLYANSSEVTRSQEGFPIGFFWGLTTDGIFQTPGDVDNYKNKDGNLIQPKAQPGDIRYVDKNGDGIISELDKTMIGDGHPNKIYGFSLDFNFKGFDLNIAANGVAGNKILQNYVDANRNYWNYTQDLWDQRWHGEGTSNRFPRFNTQNTNWIEFSDIFLYKGNYLKINTLTVGYNLVNIWKSLDKLRFYITGKNVFTFTSYNGMDPEVGWGNNNVDNSEMGRDRGIYPHPRTVLFGINMTF